MSSAHISTHGVNMTQRCHERGSLGEEGLCQASPLTVTIFYFPHIPSLEGSLFLFYSPPSFGSTLQLVDLNEQRFLLWQLADHWISPAGST